MSRSANLVDSSSCSARHARPDRVRGQSTSSSGADLQRRHNTVEAGIRYRGAFGPVVLAGSLITMQGGHIDPSNGAETSTPGGPTFRNSRTSACMTAAWRSPSRA